MAGFIGSNLSRILIENNIIPVIITDDNFNIIEYKNLNESKIKNDSLYLANVLKKMKTQYEPITVNLSDLNRSIEKKHALFIVLLLCVTMIN